MDDFKIIIYILAAVAYFLFTQWRKAFGGSDVNDTPQEPKRRPVSRQQQPQRPATSFEDILRELQPKVERAKAEAEAVSEKAQEVIPPMAPAEERVKATRKYEDSAPRALSLENKADAKQARQRSQLMRQPTFKAYDEKKAVKSRYAALMQSPGGVRDAFILSEIFNRKYS